MFFSIDIDLYDLKGYSRGKFVSPTRLSLSLVSSSPLPLPHMSQFGISSKRALAFSQNKVGPDVSALEASLAPIERYALHVRTDVDPFYSLYFRTEAQRREEVEAAGGDLDVDGLEGR